MPALRQRLAGPLGLGAALALAGLVAAAAIDLAQPPARQALGAGYVGLVRLYQRTARPVLHDLVRCRLRPSCSEYSVAAVRSYGLPRGLWLTARRLARCTPAVAAGTPDPVPPAPPAEAHSATAAR